MIGIFDSGVGGLISYREVRKLLPKEDIIYLADRRNSPYGTKTKEEIVTLLKSNISRLRLLGAQEILVACCTASTVFPLLPEDSRMGITTLIKPTAEYFADRERDKGKAVKIAVIATRHTVSSRAFSETIRAKLPNAQVTETEAQKLVAFVENGSSDGRLYGDAEKYVNLLCEKIGGYGPEYLILGCTHFSHLEGELQKRLPGTVTVSPAKLGAEDLVKQINKTRKISGSGKSLYTE